MRLAQPAAPWEPADLPRRRKTSAKKTRHTASYAQPCFLQAQGVDDEGQFQVGTGRRVERRLDPAETPRQGFQALEIGNQVGIGSAHRDLETVSIKSRRTSFGCLRQRYEARAERLEPDDPDTGLTAHHIL